MQEREEHIRQVSLKKKFQTELKIENTKRVAEEMIKIQRETAQYKETIAVQRMVQFESQRSQERKLARERAFRKTLFMKKAIEQSEALHEERKQVILA